MRSPPLSSLPENGPSAPDTPYIAKAAAGSFATLGLELGGKDPAYVRPDVNLRHAVENLVDGSFYNSGQCCCGIERIYVHEDIYEPFLLQIGFLERTPRGRIATERAYHHFGVPRTDSQKRLF